MNALVLASRVSRLPPRYFINFVNSSPCSILLSIADTMNEEINKGEVAYTARTKCSRTLCFYFILI